MTINAVMTSCIYRYICMIPFVNGLRAIAILLVVCYHYFPSFFVGGFVGVDVFFVISGFLITGILLKNNEISEVSGFYLKRIKRLIPAILPVLVFVSFVSYFYMLPDELRLLGRHFVGVGSFTSNFTLLNEVGYFDGASEYKPLLHFWSLAVEVQFYVFYPWFLIFVKRSKRGFYLYVGVLVVSFLVNIILYKMNRQDLDFYLPMSRLWEFLIGGLICFSESKKIKTVFERRWFGALFGLVLILVVFKFDGKNHYPGLRSVIPVFFSISVLSGALSGVWWSRMLDSKLFKLISDISYPWYLWHWPFIALAGLIYTGNVSITYKFILLILSFIFAFFTHVWLERPVKKISSRKCLMSIGLGYALLSVAVGALTVTNDGFPKRIVSSVEATPVQRYFSMDLLNAPLTREGNKSCDIGFNVSKDLVCIKSADNPRLLILGDSHAMAVNSALAIHRLNYPSVVVAAHGCLPFDVDKEIGSRLDCRQVIPVAMEMLKKSPTISQIWIITKYSHTDHFTIDQERSFLKKFADIFYGFNNVRSPRLAKISVLLDYPELNVNPKSCLSRPGLENTPDAFKNCSQSRSEVQKLFKKNYELLEKLPSGFSNVKVVNLLDYFCDATTCIGASPDRVYYFDTHHLTISGSEFLLRKLLNF